MNLGLSFFRSLKMSTLLPKLMSEISKILLRVYKITKYFDLIIKKLKKKKKRQGILKM
jgi:hypothetical protein